MLSFKIDDIIEDNPTFRTYVIRKKFRAKPGQFVMVWMPGVDEIPISIGWQTDEEFRLGIGRVGDCSGAIFDQIKVGDRLGLRGPFGKSYDLKSYQHIVLIGGGIGTPPLLNLAQRATEKGVKVTAILGARSKDLLIYEKEFESLGCELQVSTDDGTKGHHGYCTDILKNHLRNNKPEAIYTCGPEIMMVKVTQMAKEMNIPCEVSLERYMKCGFGICGQCCMDDSGFRVCKDGPVMEGNEALNHTEFGKYHRGQSGKRKDY